MTEPLENENEILKYEIKMLSEQHIPQILNISKYIWDGDDYIPNVIKKWMESGNSVIFGVFLQDENNEMIAFSRIKFLTTELAWLEGGRVTPKYQNTGIGLKMAQFSLNYARDKGFKRIQYDTSTLNVGSIKIGKKMGFTEKTQISRMLASKDEIEEDNMTFFPLIPNEIVSLRDNDLCTFLPEISENFQEELCIGWSFIPLIPKIIEANKVKSYRYRKAVIVVRDFGILDDKEGPTNNEMWFIVYGKPSDAIRILTYFLKKHLTISRLNSIEIFADPSILQLAYSLGFRYKENIPSGVILMEKKY